MPFLAALEHALLLVRMQNPGVSAMPDEGKSAQVVGRLEPVPVRDVMPNEARDFTNWLAKPDNLELLSTAIGLTLEPLATEVAVEEFSADLVCRAMEDATVVLIQNQYGRTDHDHLGKILTYAGGLKASTMVWIAESIRPAHRAALDWLNESTVEGVNVFGIELEFLRIGNSLPAPRFNVVSKPNDWAKQVRASAGQGQRELTEADERRVRYWKQVREAIAPSLPRQLRIGKAGTASNFWIYVPGQSWSWWFTIYVLKKGHVGWFFRAKDEAANVFQTLEARLDELQTACGCELDRTDHLSLCGFNRADWANEADWPHQMDWFRKTFPSSLLPPLARHHARQLLQLHPLRLPPVENRLLDVRRQQREPDQPVDEAFRDVFGLGDLAGRAVPALIQHPLPPVRPRQCADQRLVRPRLGGAQASVPSGAMITLRPPRRFQVTHREGGRAIGRDTFCQFCQFGFPGI
jgi:hypothetical protein